jgi:hypothetical protein
VTHVDAFSAAGDVDAEIAANALGKLLALIDAPSTTSVGAADEPFVPPGEQPTQGSETNAETVQPFEGSAPITGKFGEGRGDHTHAGLDFGVPSNTAILSMAGGTVSQVVGGGGGGGYGNFVIVDHGNGLTTRYAHLNAARVQVGQQVTAGTMIGMSGSTGKSSGPHLHFEVMQGGKPVDPTPYLAGGAAILGKGSPTLDLGDGTAAEPFTIEEIGGITLQNIMNMIEGDPLESTEKPAAGEAGMESGETGEGGDADAWIRRAMQIVGVGEDWYAPLRKRMMQESGGQNIPQGITDINTQKGTPAFGPMQMIEPTFRSHMMPGYENWKDPLHNTVAAIRYIMARYGHPSKLPKGGY